MPHLTHNNVEFYYDKQGSGECVVLMLPGCLGKFLLHLLQVRKNLTSKLAPLLGTTNLEFSQQFAHFAGDRFTIISWDAPGFGKSRPPERDYEKCYERDAELLIYLMVEHLKYSSFNLLGFSDGGRTAIVMAANYPARVQKLVLVGTSAFLCPKQRRVFDLCRNISGWSNDRRMKYEKVYGDDLQEVWNQWLNANEAYVDYLTPMLKNIHCNTMLLWGELDIIAPIEPHVRHLRTRIPNTRVHIFAKTSHYCHQDRAKDFNKMIEQFLYYL